MRNWLCTQYQYFENKTILQYINTEVLFTALISNHNFSFGVFAMYKLHFQQCSRSGVMIGFDFFFYKSILFWIVDIEVFLVGIIWQDSIQVSTRGGSKIEKTLDDYVQFGICSWYDCLSAILVFQSLIIEKIHGLLQRETDQ